MRNSQFQNSILKQKGTMQRPIALTLAILLASTTSAFAQQQPTVSPAPAASSATTNAANPSSDGKNVLQEGVDVQLKFAESISSKTASDGDPVALILDSDLKVGDVVVAKAGSKAFGEVTNVKKAGMMGKAGELNVRLTYLKVGNNKIRLRGTKGKEGESGTTGAIVLTVLFGPIGLIKHGKDIDIKQGTALSAYVSDDITLPAAL
jgi:hypothetical protein